MQAGAPHNSHLECNASRPRLHRCHDVSHRVRLRVDLGVVATIFDADDGRLRG